MPTSEQDLIHGHRALTITRSDAYDVALANYIEKGKAHRKAAKAAERAALKYQVTKADLKLAYDEVQALRKEE